MQTEIVPSIKNLKPYRGDDGYEWDATTPEGDTQHCRTNYKGQGLWCNDRQVRGTCQFSLTAQTRSGIYQQIRRQMSI